MQKIISLILDSNNQVTTLLEAEKIRTLRRQEQKWIVQKEIEACDLLSGGMVKARNNISALLEELGDCKILVGKSITGLAYNIFDNAGYIISELTDYDDEILDALYNQIEAELKEVKIEKEKIENIPTSPKETDIEGNYFFDFCLLKESNIPHSSKSTILPFLNTTKFNQLEIICDHVMPWFDMEMKKRNLDYSITEKEHNKFSILIKTK